jgi:hypothetical protein
MTRPKPAPRVRLEKRETGGYRVFVRGMHEEKQIGVVMFSPALKWHIWLYTGKDSCASSFQTRRDAIAVLMKGVRVR